MIYIHKGTGIPTFINLYLPRFIILGLQLMRYIMHIMTFNLIAIFCPGKNHDSWRNSCYPISKVLPKVRSSGLQTIDLSNPVGAIVGENGENPPEESPEKHHDSFLQMCCYLCGQHWIYWINN